MAKIEDKKMIKFISSILKIGFPLSILGIFLFMGSVHAGFNPIFYVVAPAIYFEMKYLNRFELPTLLLAYCAIQFAYYALVIFLWKKWQSRNSKLLK
jgi:hypothetical protein